MTLSYTEFTLAVIRAEIAACWLIVENGDANLTPLAMIELDAIHDYLDRLRLIGEKP